MYKRQVYYIPSNAFGVELTGAEIMTAHGLDGVNVLTVNQYLDILPAEDIDG